MGVRYKYPMQKNSIYFLQTLYPLGGKRHILTPLYVLCIGAFSHRVRKGRIRKPYMYRNLMSLTSVRVSRSTAMPNASINHQDALITFWGGREQGHSALWVATSPYPKE
jgi:hypothetical protein